MSAEERWADNQEWKEERRQEPELELLEILPLLPESKKCVIPKCPNGYATKCYVVARVGAKDEADYEFCDEHSSAENAFRRFMKDYV